MDIEQLSYKIKNLETDDQNLVFQQLTSLVHN